MSYLDRGLTIALLAAVAAIPSASSGQTLGGRVIGGIDAREGAWPYQAFIAVDEGGSFACGGTLIAPNWVLTAAHCTIGPETDQPFAAASYSVRIGSNLKSSGGTLRRVRRVIVHERYANPRPLENDIALLELDQAVAAPAVPLEGDTARISSTASPWARVIGWGLTNASSRNSAAERLQEAPLPLVDNARCNAAMVQLVPEAGPVDERRICAGQSEGGVDSCNGDSGGPLVAMDERGRWSQVGIVSYGVEDCGRPGAYGVYTRVASFTSWIARQTGLAFGSAGKPDTLQLGVAAAAPTLLAAAERGDGPVSVNVAPKDLRLGQAFRVTVTSREDGYLALFDVSADNKVTQIFPNPRSRIANRDGRVRAGQTLSLPDPSYGFEFRAAEPLGRGRLIALVAKDPQALAAAVRAEDGFKTEPASARMARLEIVLKPLADTGEGVKPLDGGTKPAPAFAAALADYIVK